VKNSQSAKNNKFSKNASVMIKEMKKENYYKDWRLIMTEAHKHFNKLNVPLKDVK